MKKMLLVDGNSMMFRAFYATIYGRPMTTSSGIHTNAVYGFDRMLNKAVELVQPDAIFVAFDSGKKTFRHEKYPEYKGTRKELPEELKIQFPIVREFLDAISIKRYEQDGIEADDIIGSLVKKYPDWDINVLTSDKDLLQLIDPTTSVWLMKKGLTEIDEMTEEKFQEQYNLVPKQMIDLKGLMGDASDNIPGVPGIGEKTALKLLWEYGSVENLLEHTEDLKGKQKENIEQNADLATLSKDLATIHCEVEVPITPEDMALKVDYEGLYQFYKQYEMSSLMKEIEPKLQGVEQEEFDYKRVTVVPKEWLEQEFSIYFDANRSTYQQAELLGFAISNGKKSVYIALEDAKKDTNFLASLTGKIEISSYDNKQAYHLMKELNIAMKELEFDLMLGAFLVDSTISDWDKLMDKYQGISRDEVAKVYGRDGLNLLIDFEHQEKHACSRALDIAKISPVVKQQIVDDEMEDLLYKLEQPLSRVLFDMETEGVKVNTTILDDIATSTLKKVESLSEQIYQLAGHPFNINSPKQLAEVLFDELNLPHSKKRSTAVDVLEKLVHAHPIVEQLMEYRKYQKLYSTYAEGLKKYIQSDGRIHTNYRQAIAQTGRLSSTDPNLQNISVRDEEGREIRKAFIPTDGCVFISADYSQIELRILAHMADEKKLIEAFVSGMDIHTQTAMDVFHVSEKEVTSLMRRQAKAVNFGIVYGISDFGLAQQLDIDRKTAKEYIDRYFISYPNIKSFMEKEIEKCQEFGYVKTLLNRKREIPQIHAKDYVTREFGKRAAMNAPIQGSAADLIKLAMLKVADKLKEEKLRSTMILQVHDELIFNVYPEEQEKIIPIIEYEMSHAMELNVPLVAECKVGKDWYDAK